MLAPATCVYDTLSPPAVGVTVTVGAVASFMMATGPPVVPGGRVGLVDVDADDAGIGVAVPVMTAGTPIGVVEAVDGFEDDVAG